MERNKGNGGKNEPGELANLVSLPAPAKSEIEVIDLLSTSIDTQTPKQTNADIFPIGGLGVFYPQVKQQTFLQDPQDFQGLQRQLFHWE